MDRHFQTLYSHQGTKEQEGIPHSLSSWPPQQQAEMSVKQTPDAAENIIEWLYGWVGNALLQPVVTPRSQNLVEKLLSYSQLLQADCHMSPAVCTSVAVGCGEANQTRGGQAALRRIHPECLLSSALCIRTWQGRNFQPLQLRTDACCCVSCQGFS